MSATLTLLAALLLASVVHLPAADLFVRAEGTALTRAGKPFKAAGFNQPDLFGAMLHDDVKGRAKSFAAIDDASRSGVREGYFFISHDPFQLPYRCLLPKTVDGLLVPVACSASYVGYQTIRMEPVFMALGEASGIAAAQAVSAKAELRAIDVPALQREILKRGGVILYEATAKRPEGL